MSSVWKKITAVGISSMLLLASWGGTAATRTYAAETASVQSGSTQGILHIVALGDSITAGYEPGMKEDAKPYGYAERLLEQGWYHGRSTLFNYGILGLTSAGLLNYTEALKSGTSVTPDDIQPGLPDPRKAAFAADIPQAAKELAAANLITITIGGNDVSSLFLKVKELSEADFEAQLTQKLADYSENLKLILANIRALNPGAKIIVADQYQPAPKIYMGASYDKLMNAADRFTVTAEDAVSTVTRTGGPILVAHVAKSFAGVEGSLTHIVSSNPPDFHPTQLGYEKIAKAFAEQQWGEYRTPSVVNSGSGATPMSIVVKGVELNTPNKPILKNGQNFLALRDILNAVDASGKWDNKTASATVVYGGRTVVITIGAKTMKVNGQAVSIDTPAFLQKVGKEEKTYLPLAALATGLGFDVNYSGPLRTAFINP